MRRGGRAGEPRARATHDQKEDLLALLREGLLAIEALPRVNTDGYFADWRGARPAHRPHRRRS